MTTLEELLRTRVARFVDRQPDWDAFADARVEGYRRAQHRYIGAGASGKTDVRAIPAEHFTLSVMFVPPGQGNAAHRHEVEEVFFVLEGKVKVFFEDGAGHRADLPAPGLLHLAVVRSPHPHARVLAVDRRAALAGAGTVAVLTVDDLPELAGSIPPLVPTPTIRSYAHAVLAGPVVRHAGEA